MFFQPVLVCGVCHGLFIVERLFFLHLVEEHVEHHVWYWRVSPLGWGGGPYSASNRQHPGGKAHGVLDVTLILDAKRTSLGSGVYRRHQRSNAEFWVICHRRGVVGGLIIWGKTLSHDSHHFFFRFDAVHPDYNRVFGLGIVYIRAIHLFGYFVCCRIVWWAQQYPSQARVVVTIRG